MANAPNWPASAASRFRPAVSETAKTVMLGGVQTVFEGAADDPYFQTLEQQAAHLDGFAAFVARQVPPSATALDVGANIGLSTILLARLAERVIAYEPSPPNVGFLRRNLELNGISNVEVRAAAVSSEGGTVRFHVMPFGAGSHVMGTGHVAGDGMAAVEVAAMALDDEGLPPLDFIKIDAEGHEPDALAGARGLLARDRPLIYTEINLWCLSAFAGHSLGALVKALFQAHEAFRPEADGALTPLPEAYQFLHDAIVLHRGVVDIALRPREGAAMPDLPAMTWPAPALAALRQQLKALP